MAQTTPTLCMLKTTLTLISTCLICILAFGQTSIDSLTKIPVKVGPWTGNAYHIVTKTHKRYYREVEDQEPFAQVKYDELNIKDRDTRQGFPQIDKTSSFGLIVYAEMDVKQAGTYGFKLGSDDGSRLYIDDQRVIDNDGPHGFKAKANRICLSAGTHKLKVWYYQGWPYRFGLTLEAFRLGEECLEPFEPIVRVKNPRNSDKEKLQMEEQAKIMAQANDFFAEPIPILFDHWKSDILPKYEGIILDIKKNISQLSNVTIRIEGHTDDTGNEDLNLKLSRDRAEAIMNAIYATATQNNNRIQSVGYGADRPVAPNDDEEGRQKNRRVEVKIIQSTTSFTFK